MAWNPAQLPSFAGRTIVVTGGNSGVGFYTALELARHQGAVTLACRNLEKAGQAADRIRALVPGANVEISELDLSSLASVRAFAQRWEGRPLDLLVNNAGVMTPPKWRSSVDGFELQFATNHLGHYALTGLLLPALQAAAAPRVVTVSSIAHRPGSAGVLFGNPEQGYNASRAYTESKLANLLFGLELQRRATEHGSALTSTMAHPGVSSTNLVSSPDGMGANPVIRAAWPIVGAVIFQSARAGANPTLYASADAAPGSYTGPQWLREVRGPVGPARLSPTAQDPELARQLWELSGEWTGVEYDWQRRPSETPA